MDMHAEPLLTLDKAMPDFIKEKIAKRKGGNKSGDKKAKKNADEKAGSKRSYEKSTLLVRLEDGATVLAKTTVVTSRDAGHTHSLELPANIVPGTYATRPARTPGAPRSHMHVFVVRSGMRPGATVTSSRGVDGHIHRVTIGSTQTGRALRRSAGIERLTLCKALDISGANSAAVTGADSARKESLDGALKDKQKRLKKKTARKSAPLVVLG